MLGQQTPRHRDTDDGLDRRGSAHICAGGTFDVLVTQDRAGRSSAGWRSGPRRIDRASEQVPSIAYGPVDPERHHLVRAHRTLAAPGSLPAKGRRAVRGWRFVGGRVTGTKHPLGIAGSAEPIG
jgi:hypothetical protein